MNIISTFEPMETIFDHNLTKSEQEELLGHTSKERYLSLVSQKGAYIKLAYLFYMRGDEKKAAEYINKTDDCNYINSFWRTVKHP